MNKGTEKKRQDPRKRPVPTIARAPAKSAAPAKVSAHGAPGKGGRARGEEPEHEGPKFVGGTRNQHGTRVARRITCTRCGLVDHVPYVPRDESKALCRACAAELLDTYEKGTRAKVPTRPVVCNLCGAPFALPLSAEDDDDPLCRNCLKGFTTWQGSVDTPFAERAEHVIEERLSGTVVRKKKPRPPA